MQCYIPVSILEKQGYKVTYLDVDREGFINVEDLKMQLQMKLF